MPLFSIDSMALVPHYQVMSVAKLQRKKDIRELSVKIPFKADQRTLFESFVDRRGLKVGRYILGLILKDIAEQDPKAI